MERSREDGGRKHARAVSGGRAGGALARVELLTVVSCCKVKHGNKTFGKNISGCPGQHDIARLSFHSRLRALSGRRA